jgi:hypothetical protein
MKQSIIADVGGSYSLLIGVTSFISCLSPALSLITVSLTVAKSILFKKNWCISKIVKLYTTSYIAI